MGTDRSSTIIVVGVIAVVLTRIPRVISEDRLWREEWYRGMLIDHFSYYADADRNNTFDLRYLVNDTWWNRDGGPIFFYTGNEGAIEDFAKQQGLMYDWAPDTRALLIFAEHRYYGQSLPYGNESFQMPNLYKLTVDHVLADYAQLITWLKTNLTGAAASPVITFGGSYGGMLAAYMRLAHPDLVYGAIASSAPIMQLPNSGIPCKSFGAALATAMDDSAPGCNEMANRFRSAIDNMSNEGIDRINEIFGFCDGDKIKFENETDIVRYTATQTWLYFAMANYPYENDVIRPLPAYSLRTTCQYMTDPSDGGSDEGLVKNMVRVLRLYYNHTGQLKDCFTFGGNVEGISQNDWLAWAFQGCADLTLNNECNDGKSIFKPYEFPAEVFAESCQETFGVRPRWNWLTMNYGIQRIRLSSNIIFTSGHYDPWDGTVVKEEHLRGADPSLVAIQIRDGAHHYDLLGSHPGDTPEIVEVRNRMKSLVQRWIQTAAALPRLPMPLFQMAALPSNIGVSDGDRNNTSTPSVVEFQKLGPPELEGKNATDVINETNSAAIAAEPIAPVVTGTPAGTTTTGAPMAAALRMEWESSPPQQPFAVLSTNEVLRPPQTDASPTQLSTLPDTTQ